MKPDKPVFDKQWRDRCRVVPITKKMGNAAIMRHYLKKWPGVTTLIMGLMDGWDVLGVIVFALPPRETHKRYGGTTWELARLWVHDSVPQNAETFLISRAVRHIRKAHADVTCIVSYADPSAGHAGTVYRAANWRSDGMTDEGRKTPRVDYACAATGRKFSRRAHIPDGIEFVRVPRVSKHRFIYQMVTQ